MANTNPTETPSSKPKPQHASSPASQNGVEENLLDPSLPSEPEVKRIPLIIRVYGFICLADGILSFASLALFFGIIGWALFNDPGQIAIGSNPTLALVMVVIGAVLGVVSSGALVFFGASIMRSQRRNVVRWSYVLIVFTILQIIVEIMIGGVELNLLRPAAQLAILIALSATVDPTLRQERQLQRRLRDLIERERAREGLLGRDATGKGYIELNFFNLFWVFVVCCVLGLILETIWHFVVVEPGAYQDRAGLLFGPFSPIYGFGAVLMTVFLNRLYDNNPIWIFLASAVIGTLFEYATAMFMQMGFGAISWDYSQATIFGLPDPLAQISDGHVSTMFACMWGALGCIWIKWCLPHLLKLINLIPWTWRYSLTTVCAALMLIDGVMTLQSLDCWFERVSGQPISTPVEQFYAEHFDNGYMQHRFQSMTITPDNSGRVNAPAGEA